MTTPQDHHIVDLCEVDTLVINFMMASVPRQLVGLRFLPEFDLEAVKEEGPKRAPGKQVLENAHAVAAGGLVEFLPRGGFTLLVADIRPWKKGGIHVQWILSRRGDVPALDDDDVVHIGAVLPMMALFLPTWQYCHVWQNEDDASVVLIGPSNLQPESQLWIDRDERLIHTDLRR